MPLEFGDIVIAFFPCKDEDRATRNRRRPCLVICDHGSQIEVAYGTSSPTFVERYNAQIIRHEVGEAGGWKPGAFVLRRRRVLPKTTEFFPDGAAAIAQLSMPKRARAYRIITELAALEKWEGARHRGGMRHELRKQQGSQL